MTMNSDPALWEMFRTEVDTHRAVLSDGLLALERDPSQSTRFELMMRAAHSIKGAAKIVGIPAAVEVAHALEDCFVAAREGRLSMSSSLVDVLFEGVDLLGRVAQDDTSDAAIVVMSKVNEVTAKIARATRVGMPDAEAAGAAPRTTRQTHDDTIPIHVFRPVGSLNAAWTKTHHRDVATLLRQGCSDVYFDLANVESIDPVGLALLSVATRSVAKGTTPQKVTIHLNGVSPRLARLLQATGLDRGCRVAAAEG